MVVVVATHAGDGYVECLSAMPLMMRVLSGNAADGETLVCAVAFAVAPSLLLLAAVPVRALTNDGAGGRATWCCKSAVVAAADCSARRESEI